MTAPIATHGPLDLPLHAALRSCARGLYAVEASVELPIEHATFLHRNDFRVRFIEPGTSITDGTSMAAIDWAAAITALDTGALPCSDGESRVRLAASLAHGLPVSLRDAVTGIDDRNVRLPGRAVLHASRHGPEPKIS